jgi:hypothetical protein
MERRQIAEAEVDYVLQHFAGSQRNAVVTGRTITGRALKVEIRDQGAYVMVVNVRVVW